MTEGEGLREIGKSHSVPRVLFGSDAIDGLKVFLWGGIHGREN